MPPVGPRPRVTAIERLKTAGLRVDDLTQPQRTAIEKLTTAEITTLIRIKDKLGGAVAAGDVGKIIF